MSRATDAAGNIGTPTAWQKMTVDTVTPLITATQRLRQIKATDYLPGSARAAAVLEGSASDGYGLSEVMVRVFKPGGQSKLEHAVLTGTSWSYTPQLGYGESGDYRLRVEATDGAGNTTLGTIFELQVAPPIFFPITFRNAGPANTNADLVATISLTPNKTRFVSGELVTITVVVENRGSDPAPPFWVDLLINPSAPPNAANQIWSDHCGLTPCYGIVWAVSKTLAAGERIVLTSTSTSYAAPYTRWPGYFAPGTSNLYAYVDSWNPGVATGAVAERDESNNLAVLQGLSVSGSLPALAEAQAWEEPPPRPVTP